MMFVKMIQTKDCPEFEHRLMNVLGIIIITDTDKRSGQYSENCGI